MDDFAEINRPTSQNWIMFQRGLNIGEYRGKHDNRERKHGETIIDREINRVFI